MPMNDGEQAGRPSSTRNTIYMTFGLWNMLKNNPLALAQFMAHELYHLNPDKPKMTIEEEERLAMQQEKDVYASYVINHPEDKNPVELRALLPSCIRRRHPNRRTETPSG